MNAVQITTWVLSAIAIAFSCLAIREMRRTKAAAAKYAATVEARAADAIRHAKANHPNEETP